MIALAGLMQARHCPGTPKWVSRALNALPHLAGEIGPIREGGLSNFGLQDVEDALRESLSPELRELAAHGGCDQWVTNDDLLLWPEQYGKFKHIYGQEGPIRRDGVGDRMIQMRSQVADPPGE